MDLNVKKIEKGLIFSIMLSVGVYFVFFLFSDFNQIMSALYSINVSLILSLLFLSLLGYFIRFLRWQVFTNNANIRISLINSMKVFFAGLGLTITPGKIGELFKASFLKKFSGDSRIHSLVIVILERVFDLVGFSIIILTSIFFVGFREYRELGVVVSGFILFLVFCFFLLVRLKIVQEFILSLCKRFSFLEKRIKTVKKVLNDYSSISIVCVFILILLSILGWFLEVIELWLLLDFFNVSASVFDAGFVYGISSIIGIISLLPGGIGGFEASSGLLITNILKTSVEVSAVITFIIRLTTLWFGVFIGLINYFFFIKE